MKIFSANFTQKKKKPETTVSEYQQQMLIRQGREQFKKLLDKGLRVPVALL